MIVVANTRDLENRYDLSRIRDDEQIMVQGGMQGKPKYNAERYQQRRTYSGRELKQIIGQMKVIESSIPREWNQMQRAKYIYEVLGKGIEYNFNRAEYDSQKPSNLSILLSRKGICAGYSLLYKEMMDRQGIQCDYVRGIGTSADGSKRERHAWNVLTIDGKSFPVDLTWDSPVLRRGETELQYFGVDERFFDRHIIDQDERQYNYVRYSKEAINAVNTNPNIRQSDRNQVEFEQSQKDSIIQLAMKQTYLRFRDQVGSEAAKTQVEKAIEKYITTGDAMSFTRQGGARQQIEQFISPRDMLSFMAKSFVEQNEQGRNANFNGRVLENSVNETSRAYGTAHTTNAILKYISEGKINGFTRTNNARGNLEMYAILPGTAMNLIIDTVARQNINEIEINNPGKTIEMPKNYFYADELAQADLPAEKKTGLISKAVQWIKDKIKERHNSKGKQNQEIQSEYSRDDEDQR